MNKNIYLLPIAILGYSAWNAMELLNAWGTAPLEKHAWLLWIIWLIPIGLTWVIPPVRTRFQFNPILLCCALLFTLLGVLSSLNVIKYAGFAFALASFTPFDWSMVPWMVSSLSWMPAFGWLGSRVFPDWEYGVRLIVVCIGVGSWILLTRNSRSFHH